MLKLKTHRRDLPFFVLQRWFENLEAGSGRAALKRLSSGAAGGAGRAPGLGCSGHFLLNDKRARVPWAVAAPGDLGLRAAPGSPLIQGASGAGREGRRDLRTLSPRHRAVATWGWPPHAHPQRGRRRCGRATRKGDDAEGDDAGGRRGRETPREGDAAEGDAAEGDDTGGRRGGRRAHAAAEGTL